MRWPTRERATTCSSSARWLPAAALDDLRARLLAEVGPEVVVVERASRGEHPPDAPVVLENRRLTRAFEPLASFVTLPRYGSLDPTPLLAITLPAFVGLMIGDAGYGLVMLALLALARWRWRSAPAMAVVWPVGVTAALATIVFGVLFGEWFGGAGHDLLGIEPVWLDRREAMIPLLVLALSIGVAQVGLGLVLGVVNAVLLRHRREVAGRIALLVSLAATMAILGWIVGRLPDGIGYLGLGSLVLALAVLIATLGLAGPIEVMGMLGNVISYARLMAIGLASVMLAVVAARLAGLFENVIVGALVAALIHALNLVLGVFDSTVQGLRLHYVEFFTKFVEPGGVRYAPFASALPARDRPSGSRPDRRLTWKRRHASWPRRSRSGSGRSGPPGRNRGSARPAPARSPRSRSSPGRSSSWSPCRRRWSSSASSWPRSSCSCESVDRDGIWLRAGR